MFPRNVIFYRFDAELQEGIEEALRKHTIRDPGPQEMATSGFRSPYGPADDRRVIRQGKVLGFAYELRERDLTARAVSAELDRRVMKIAEDEDRLVGGRERKRIRDDILTELLPKAVIIASVTRGWIDLGSGRVVIDARTRRKAENVLSSLREAFGSFPAVPPAPEESPRVLMTHWLAQAEAPKGVAFGTECELRDPSGAHGSVVRCRRQDLDTDEIREHLRSGKQCFSAGLVFDDRLDLVLADDLSIKALRPTDVLADESGGISHASQDEETEGGFALAVLEVSRLLTFVETTFRIPTLEQEAA